jgi:hypothetical protein
MQQFHLIQCVSVVVAAVPITIASFFSDLIGKISRVQELVRRLCDRAGQVVGDVRFVRSAIVLFSSNTLSFCSRLPNF